MPNTLPVPGVQVARSNSAASLSDLAEVIRAEHAAVVRASNDVLHHVLAAGRFLIEAQGIVPKGQWAGWVSRSCEVSYRTARLYMQITRAYEANGNGVASDLVGLSLRGLIRALASPKQANEVRRRHSRPVPGTPDKDRAINAELRGSENEIAASNLRHATTSQYRDTVPVDAVIEIVSKLLDEGKLP